MLFYSDVGASSSSSGVVQSGKIYPRVDLLTYFETVVNMMSFKEVADLVKKKLTERKVSEDQVAAVIALIEKEEINSDGLALLDNVSSYAFYPQELVSKIKSGTKVSLTTIIANLKIINAL